MQYEPQEMEKKILDFWEKNKLRQKSLKQREKSKKRFSFIDGPPTANNPMGVHHAWGRTYKDVFLRLKTMQGFDTRKQPGFDCQGLWVEVGIEKELGFKNKKEIECFGLDKFVDKCVCNVKNYVNIWIDLSKKLGMWMDWENPYLTLTDKNIENIWYFLKTCHEKKWLYQGFRVLPWCARCGTSLSSHEVSGGYQNKKHTSIYFKFKVKEQDNTYLLIYTTTPWTLASNVAVAANPNEEYAKIKVGNEYYILGKALIEKLFLEKDYKTIDIFFGRELVELSYDNPLKDSLPLQWNVNGRVVLSKDFVSMDEGTGLVHIAPGHGPEDYQIGQEFNLPVLSPLDEDGKFTEDAGFLKGMGVKQANKLMMEKLDEMGVIFKKVPIEHSYPCCWRCGEELVYRTGEEWFISAEEIRPMMVKAAEPVVGYPEWTKKSMMDWVSNLRDWNISRKRYYGVPLPFWKCDCGHLEVIGSVDELKKKAASSMDQLKELHRPWVDNVIIKCPECKKDMKRIEEVGDCWLDAGIVPYSTLGYFDDKKYWNKWFPADFITEMHEQVRFWFNAMMFMSVALENKAPYKSFLAHGMVLDEKMREMHKSTGNAIWADEALEKIGADVMRWMYCTQNPGQPMPFGYTPAKEVRKILNVLFNTSKFLETYMEANKLKPTESKKLDQASLWLLARLQSVKETVTSSMDEMKPHIATKTLQDFFLNDLSRWYGQIIRSDIKPDVESDKKQVILSTFYKVMLETLQLLSPFIPFMTESLYQDFFKKFEKEESIHFTDWPEIEKKYQDKDLEEAMEAVRKIVETSNSIRHEKTVKLRYKLPCLTIDIGEKTKAVEKLSEIISNMANVQEVKFLKIENGKEVEGMKVELDTEGTPELREEWLISELTRSVQSKRKKMGLQIKDKITLHLPEDELFQKEKEAIQNATSSKIVFGKLKGDLGEAKFEDKKYEFGISV
ncbi:MAG: isoleucine--tRNA ligase [Candidatus Aenigmarchaeota archaeon]|nr:isoleucine--tRNA ligase [Candidatus Aenigmarchaeota archaeon]